MFSYILKIWSTKLFGWYELVRSHIIVITIVVVEPKGFLLLLPWLPVHFLKIYKVLTDVYVGCKLVYAFFVCSDNIKLFLLLKDIFAVKNLRFLVTNWSFIISHASGTFHK